MATSRTSLQLTWTGLKEFLARLKHTAAAVPDALEDAAYRGAERVMRAAKGRYVPVNDGYLRASGMVHRPIRVSREVTIKMTFGGVSAPYAAAVHEHPSELSPRSWKGKSATEIKSVRSRTPWVDEGSGRGPKYLERPLREAIPELRKDAAERVKRAIEGNR